MVEFTNNTEFFGALPKLIDAWCDRRSVYPLALIFPAYVGCSSACA